MPVKKNERVQTAIETKQRTNRRRKILAALFVLLAAISLWGPELLQSVQSRDLESTHQSVFNEKISLLKDAALSDPAFQQGSPTEVNTVFLSISDSTSRATVFTATGDDLETAWNEAGRLASHFLQETGLEPVWVKADVVDHVEHIQTSDLPQILKPYRNEFFRKGIAFDPAFSTAFMEAEINGNKLIDYDTNTLNLENINGYLNTFGRNSVGELPQELVLFTARGWFCDEESQVFELYGYEENGHDYGRRVIPEFNREVVEEILLSATHWLGSQVKDDGAFIYGYYPTYDRQFVAYNLLRHTVSIQPFMWHHHMTGSDVLAPQMEETLRYLTEEHVEYTDTDTAYVIDRPNNEVKLGGNALAIITLDLYMSTYNSDQYLPLVQALGNGILDLMDLESGTFFHVLNTDFTPKDAFRTVYYDGESTYALTLLYERTGDEKWLQAARSAAENFIREDYTRHRDHWVAYAMNELTKHDPDQRYYAFALRNVQENLDAIYHRDTSYHTYLELLMASYELYHRIKTQDLQVDYMDQFDEAYFIETIFRRAEHMLNGFFYPEYSMYLQNPQRITGTFHIRHDGYRVRIDDVEHFIAGYYNFWRHHEQLTAYRALLAQ